MKKKNYTNLILILLGLCVVSYTFYKGITSSFTHDESFTYNNYVNIPVSDIINYTNCPDIPNNHIFNTLLMKYSQKLFGNSEFALRLPNLLAHIAFIIFSILLLRKTADALFIISGFIVLNFNTYILDFFSMARGYGLSLSLMLISVYYLINYFNSIKSKHAWLSILMGALSVWSNFTLLNYYVALIAVFLLFVFERSLIAEKIFLKKIMNFLIQSLPVWVISYILYKLISMPLETIKGNLFGPEEGFYRDTIRSVIFCSTDYDEHDLVTKVSIFVFIVVIVSAIFYFYDLIKKQFNFNRSYYILILLVMCLAAFSTILQHYLYKTQYLQNRTGIFYIVLFNVCFVNLYSWCVSNLKFKKFIHGIFLLYPVFCIVFFVNGFNIKFHRDWKYDCNTKEMMNLLKADHQNSPTVNHNINLGINWLFEPTINYYRVTRHLDWLNPVNRDGYEGDFDYYYLWNDMDFVMKKNLTVIKKFDIAESVLAKKLTPGQ